eukprot:scaffold2319_cov406-Prasinococcus_capsulatus_cf.AAC.3
MLAHSCVRAGGRAPFLLRHMARGAAPHLRRQLHFQPDVGVETAHHKPSVAKGPWTRSPRKMIVSARSLAEESSAASAPKRIRAITMDITGTAIAFTGRLGEWYALSAKRCGIACPPELVTKIEYGFHRAYKETTEAYPCFGGEELSSKDWWRKCVQLSFQYSGAQMTDEQAERLFQRIYSLFGSHSTYEAFPDALPFLRWANRNKLALGVISNADERYGDAILPMLDLADDFSFFCFSKEIGHQKPEKPIFDAALRAANATLPVLFQNEEDETGSSASEPLEPAQMLHIGNDFTKDFQGARNAGMHAILLNRFHEEDHARAWRSEGAIVLNDLLDVVEWLGRSHVRLG